jgi:hypothetical protein
MTTAMTTAMTTGGRTIIVTDEASASNGSLALPGHASVNVILAPVFFGDAMKTCASSGVI